MAENSEHAEIVQKIADLEVRAAKLKSLLENGTAKRPLIIEFSGAPKSGKTRSISVLELFLKRNGIKAEVFTERASISPIKTKGHLYFNVWVSCASLQGMLEALYRDLDVFILDRGIFDALVWNEWLEMTGKITRDEAEQIAQFFTMGRWAELVDIVFVLTCDPKTSIEREYADQLTTKRGTIMAEGTLNQFLESTNKTLVKNSAKFKKIVRIDTTNTKTQVGVAKIADEALKVLNSFLDESICVVPIQALQTQLPVSGFVSDPTTISGFVETVKNFKAFSPRSDAEQNPNYLQPIPCAVLRYDDKILILRRKKPGHPLHDKYDVWAGGHVNKADDDGDILLKTLHRELEEEVFIKEAFELNPNPIGLIRTNEDARASRHIAVLYELTLKNENVALAMNQKEFRSTRGNSMSGRLVSVNEIGNLYEEMGNWSKFIVGYFWPDQLPKPKNGKGLFQSS
jgi:predicted NUDIX family phosphoesterase/thymidylate kinase